MVGGDGAQLGNEEERRDLVAEFFNGEDGLVTAVAGDEVLGLQLAAAGGRKVHAEVGHALIPGAGDAALLGAGLGVVAGDGMQLFGAEFCAVEDDDCAKESLWLE